MRRLGHGIGMGVLVAALPFCGSGGDGDVCSPGRQVSCACPNGAEGAQKCNSKGTAYGSCDCSGSGDGGGGTSASGGSSASAGTTAVGGGGGSGTGGGGTGGSGTGGGSTGGSGTGGGASGSGGGTADGGATCPPGEATDAVKDECDVILQDCPSPETCTVEPTDAGPYHTVCSDYADGKKKLGELCDFHQDCAAGLRCTLKKCTRPCCADVEAQQCGSGDCDLRINFGGGTSFIQVCTFSPPCTPWAGDCPVDVETDCHLAFNGKTQCSFPNYAPDAGSTHGKPCKFLNDCQNDQQCSFESSGATMGTCRWLCKVKDEGAPSSGTVGGAPGKGGCPSGQTCRAFTSPDWLGVCRP